MNLQQELNFAKRIQESILHRTFPPFPERKEQVFNPFFTTKAAGEGTGLVLSLSYDIIVKAHGGELSFETEENKYTEFIVRLPRGGDSHVKP